MNVPRSRRLALLRLTVFSLCSTVLAATTVAESTTSEQEILALEQQVERAILNHDGAALTGLLADDWKVVHVNGREQTRSQFLDALTSGRAKFLSINRDEIHVRFFGHDTAIVTARWSNTIEFRGDRSSGQDRVTRVWVKQDGRWRAAEDHASFIESNPKPASTPAEDEKDILRVHRAMLRAWSAGDVNTILSTFAPDFEYWSFKGIRRNRDDLLRLIEKSQGTGDKDLATELLDPIVKVYGDAAVMTARVVDTGAHADGTRFRGETCVTMMYVRRGGRWQIVAEHETLLQPIV
jgi:uncharacterized protein (TIGR02246 family)